MQKINSQGEEKHDVSQFRTPKREESGSASGSRGERLGASGRQPLPPPAPPTHFSRGVADALGKREWQIAQLKEGEDTFFEADTNTFEERGLLGVRKEI